MKEKKKKKWRKKRKKNEGKNERKPIISNNKTFFLLNLQVEKCINFFSKKKN